MVMKFEINTQSETEALAGHVAACVEPGDVIALYGDLGVGKSVFCRAFIRSLTTEDEEVPSPTFTLVQVYDAEGGEVYHFDMYRLEAPDDCLELGVEEAFMDGVCLVEWPTKIGNYLPWDCLKVTIAHGEKGETSRTLSLASVGKWQDRLKGIRL